MTDHSPQQDSRVKRGKQEVPIEDLLLAQSEHGLTDYVALSFKDCGDHTKVRMTTTDAQPLTYCAYIPVSSPQDLASMVFVAQSVEPNSVDDQRSLPDKRIACVRIARLAPFWRVLRQKGSQRRR